MPRKHRRRAQPEWYGRDVITVAALPSRGLYVRHLGHPEGVDGVHRPDVVPAGWTTRSFASFHADWLAAHVEEVDVVHLHGLPAGASLDDVRRAVEVVRDAARPLVVTAYHVSDPSGRDEAGYAAKLAAVLDAAAAVVTLTPGAAGELRDRFGADAAVVPHPHVVDFVTMRRDRAPRGRFTVGADLGTLRRPTDPVAFVRALSSAVRAVPGAALMVQFAAHLVDPESPGYAPAVTSAIRREVDAAGGSCWARPPMTEAQLWSHLLALDVSVLPPLHGSHSVWPEACFDLGTQLVIPGASRAADQQPCLTYTATPATVHADSLAAALSVARETERPWRADPAERWKQRVDIAESLRLLYERLLPAT